MLPGNTTALRNDNANCKNETEYAVHSHPNAGRRCGRRGCLNAISFITEEQRELHSRIAVAAHGITSGPIAVTVLSTGLWSLWS
jgi:hypothetical protein